MPWLTRPTKLLSSKLVSPVDGRVRLADAARQLRRVDERQSVEGVEQVSV